MMMMMILTNIDWMTLDGDGGEGDCTCGAYHSNQIDHTRSWAHLDSTLPLTCC